MYFILNRFKKTIYLTLLWIAFIFQCFGGKLEYKQWVRRIRDNQSKNIFNKSLEKYESYKLVKLKTSNNLKKECISNKSKRK